MMDKVYIVRQDDHGLEMYTIIGVYSSREKAVKFIEDLRGDFPNLKFDSDPEYGDTWNDSFYHVSFYIEEWEVQ